MNELEQNPDVTRLVGHSVASSVIPEISNRNSQKYMTRPITPTLFHLDIGTRTHMLYVSGIDGVISIFARNETLYKMIKEL